MTEGLVPVVSIRRPGAALASYVTFSYVVTAACALTDFLYPEWGNVRFALAGDWHVTMPSYPAVPQIETVFGPTDRCGTVEATSGRMAGFGLTPLGWARLFGDASVLANDIRPLGDEFGIPAAVIRHALRDDPDDDARHSRLEALVAAALAVRAPDDPALVAVDVALRGRPRDVVAFAAAAGVSPRTLHRLCLRVFGFAPKRLLRRQRFLETLGLVRTAVGAPVTAALSPDYFDQPHFYRDFRDFMGMSPRAYFTAARTLMARAADAQRAAGVTLSFRLPPPPASGGHDRRAAPPAQPRSNQT